MPFTLLDLLHAACNISPGRTLASATAPVTEESNLGYMQRAKFIIANATKNELPNLVLMGTPCFASLLDISSWYKSLT